MVQSFYLPSPDTCRPNANAGLVVKRAERNDAIDQC